MYSLFESGFLRVAFLGLILSFLSNSAFADLKATLDFSRAFIQSRIEFKKDLARYFSDPQGSEDEKSEVFSDLMGDGLVQFLTPALAAKATLLTVDRYEDVLQVVFSDQTEGWIQEFEKFTHIKADRDLIRLQRLQVHLWMLKKDEFLLRKTLRKKDLSVNSDARMVELDTLDKLMSINTPQLPDWFSEFLNQYEHVQPDPTVVQGFLTRPSLQKNHKNIVSIVESLLEPEKFNVPTNAKAADKVVFRKYQENWESPLHESYHSIIAFQKKVQADVKSTDFNLNPSEAENRAATFLIYDFGFLTHKLFKEYRSLLFEMRDRAALLDPYRIRKKKAGKSGKTSGSRNKKNHKIKSKNRKDHSEGNALIEAVTPQAQVQVEQRVADESFFEDEERKGEPQQEGRHDLGTVGLDPLNDSVMSGREEAEKPVFSETPLAADEDPLPPEIKIYSKHFYLTSDYKKKVADKLSSEELAMIKEKFTGGHYEKIFRLFFDDRDNHLSLSFKDIKGLVERIGGKIYKSGSGSSHRTVVIPGGVAHSWKPGKRGKRKTETKLPRKCVQLYRKCFEDAGITPETILN